LLVGVLGVCGLVWVLVFGTQFFFGFFQIYGGFRFFPCWQKPGWLFFPHWGSRGGLNKTPPTFLGSQQMERGDFPLQITPVFSFRGCCGLAFIGGGVVEGIGGVFKKKKNTLMKFSGSRVQKIFLGSPHTVCCVLQPFSHKRARWPPPGFFYVPTGPPPPPPPFWVCESLQKTTRFKQTQQPNFGGGVAPPPPKPPGVS